MRSGEISPLSNTAPRRQRGPSSDGRHDQGRSGTRLCDVCWTHYERQQPVSRHLPGHLPTHILPQWHFPQSHQPGASLQSTLQRDQSEYRRTNYYRCIFVHINTESLCLSSFSIHHIVHYFSGRVLFTRQLTIILNPTDSRHHLSQFITNYCSCRFFFSWSK